MPKKELTKYIEEKPAWWGNSINNYSLSPAKEFLSEVVHLSDAMNQCLRSFSKTQDGEYLQDSLDSIYRLTSSTLAAMLGHFEVYQRFLFAGVFEASRFIKDFDISNCCRILEKDVNLRIDINVSSSYRGQPAPIGQLIADNLKGWHEPRMVNSYFSSIVKDVNLYSNNEIEDLKLLWQLRHSIVHTGGWLTQPDSQKISGLKKFGNKPVLLKYSFIEIVSKKFHKIIKSSVDRLARKFISIKIDNLSAEENELIKNLFLVKSRRNSWF